MRTPSRASDMPQRSYSYARISTGGDQAEGDGLRRQQGTADDDREPWPVRVSREQGWILDDTLRFTDTGKSGYHQHNLKPTADLARFLALVEQKRITPGSVLLIEQIDRLSRAAVDEAYDLFRGILKAGIWICTKVPFRIYRPGSDSSFLDIMEPLWIMYVAWMESEKKSERAGAAWETARKLARETGKPLPGKCPFWIRQTPQGHELITPACEAILYAHKLAQAGKGACAICQILESEGVPRPAQFREMAGIRVRKHAPWNESTVQWLLKCRVTLGEYQPRQRGKGVAVLGEPVRGYYPCIPGLDEDSWARTQRAIAGRKCARGRPGKQSCNIFLGLAHDAVSRIRLVIRSKGRGPGHQERKYPYLTSHNVGGLRIPYETLEDTVLETLKQLRPADVMDRPDEANDREREITRLTRRLEALETRRVSLQRAAADPDRDLDDALASIEAVKAEKKEVGATLERLKLESSTGRGEALGACQGLAAELHRLREEGDEEGARELQERIRAALPGVLAAVWVQSQPIALRTQIWHVQMWLHSGVCRYVQILPPRLNGVAPWDLRPTVCDLRRGAYATLQAMPA